MTVLNSFIICFLVLCDLHPEMMVIGRDTRNVVFHHPLVEDGQHLTEESQENNEELVSELEQPLFKHQSRKRRSASMKLCGDLLMSALELVCEGNARRKRDLTNNLDQTNRYQLSFLSGPRGRGLSMACCTFSCTVEQLASYC